jgi:hypothetical protein
MTCATSLQSTYNNQASRGACVWVRLVFAALAMFCLPSLASAQTANLWIDANGGSCTRQGGAAGYNDAAACGSIQAAVAACAPGDVIRMKAGSYGSQSVTAAKTAPGCTVIAEPNTTLNGRLSTSGAWYELQNITGSNAGWQSGGNNITCRNCNFSGAQVDWSGVSNVSWIGGSLRNFSCGVGCDHGMGIYNSASNLLIEGVTFDNIRGIGEAQGQHFEVIRIDGNINGLTLRKSKFTNNLTSTSTIFFSTWEGIKPRNIVVENSLFTDSGAYYHFNQNLQNQSSCENWTFRYNTFTGSQGLLAESGKCNGYANVVWLGNLAPRGSGCVGSAFRYNVWYGSSGSGCDASDTVTASSGLGGADGFQLMAGAGAIDRGGSGGECIATDYVGNSRPTGGRCDAGAYEYGASTAAAPPPPAPLTPPLNVVVR